MKHQTGEIHRHLCELGKALGFEAVTEYSFDHDQEVYLPRHDVVWFLPLSSGIEKAIGAANSARWRDLAHRIPIASFEVEGSATSSKNQWANFANVKYSAAYFKFIVVNNAATNGENDTYRRAVKICHSFVTLTGQGNYIVLDWHHLSQLMPADYGESAVRLNDTTEIGARSAVGGESKSKSLYDYLRAENFFGGRLYDYQNWQPETFAAYYHQSNASNLTEAGETMDFLLHRRFYHQPEDTVSRLAAKPADAFYIPRIDAVSGFYLGGSFCTFLRKLAAVLGSQSVQYPILYLLMQTSKQETFIPLIAYEIESSESKHMAGGILNASMHSIMGFLVTPFDAEHYLAFFRQQFGLNNVFNIVVGK